MDTLRSVKSSDFNTDGVKFSLSTVKITQIYDIKYQVNRLSQKISL